MRPNRARRRKERRGLPGQLPRSSELWLGDFVGDDAAAAGVPGTGPEALVAWVDAGTLEPVALEVVPRERAERALADLLITAMQQPESGSPRRPASVAVSRPGAERLVRERVRGLGIEVRLDEQLEAWKLAMVHVLGALASHAPDRSYLAGDGVTPELVGRLFRAAAACYRETPWAVFDDWTPFEIELPGHPVPALLVATEDDDDGRPAVGLFLPDPDAFRAPDDDDDVPAGRRLHLSFQPEDEVPDTLAAARRAHGWPLAAPDAFPFLHLDVISGEPREADAAELEDLAAALAVIPAFLARHRDAVEAGDDVVDTVDVGDVVRGSHVVRVTFPAPSGRGADWELLLAGALPEPDGLGLLEEEDDDGAPLDALRRRVTVLPHARSVIDRLAWSFFRDAGPSYIDADDDAETEDALARFLDWAAFLARVRPGRRTLVEEALERAAAEVSPAELAALDRLAHPRYSVYEITGITPGEGLALRDLSGGETLHVRDRIASRSLRTGWLLVGLVHPATGDACVLGTVSAFEPGTADREGLGLGDADPAHAALEIEEAAYGAGVDWIRSIETRRELKRAYDRFRTALGEPIPSYPGLEHLIRKAQTPQAVLDDALLGVHWWTHVEPELFLALLERAWNLTR